MKALAIIFLFGRSLFPAAAMTTTTTTVAPVSGTAHVQSTSTTSEEETQRTAKAYTSIQAAAAKDTIIVRLKNKNKLLMITNDGDLQTFSGVDLPSIVRKLDSSRAGDGTIKLNDSTYRMKSKSYRVVGSNSITLIEVNRPLHYRDYKYRDSSGSKAASVYVSPRTTHQLDIDLGLNMYLENGGQVESNQPYTLDNLNSRYVALRLMNSTRIGEAKSPHRFQYGIEVSWFNFRYNKKVKIDQEDGTGNLIWVTAPAGQPDYEASKLTVAYLNVPLMYYHQSKKGLRWGLGGYVGYKLDEYNKVEQDRATIRGGKGDFNINTFQAGVRAQVGWRGVDFFCNYNLTSLHRTGRGPQLTPIAFGISL